ncbi:PepSY domain-containing protein [Arsenicitalea aurantiaca]|nr:PepSY domain-containing protein [Arsenicitalea aurantiaca]
MRLTRHALLLATALALPAGLAIAQMPIEQLPGTVIQGEVGDVFGSRFLIEDETGRVLVDPARPLAEGLSLENGETLVIVGEATPDGFRATSVTRADGTELLAGAPAAQVAQAAPATPAASAAPVASGPIDEAAAIAILEGMGFSDIRLDDREDDHFEFEVRDADGRDIDIDLYFDGTIRDIDVDDDRRATSVDLSLLLPEEVQRAIAERGIVDVMEFESRRNHYKVEGYTEDGREIEIEIRNDDRVGRVSVDGPRPRVPADFNEAALRDSVEGQGYVISGALERKPRHVELVATNPEGEPVRLHVDLNGEVYKEQLRRGF